MLPGCVSVEGGASAAGKMKSSMLLAAMLAMMSLAAVLALSSSFLPPSPSSPRITSPTTPKQPVRRSRARKNSMHISAEYVVRALHNEHERV
jgi:hypothetical protein